jgi:hypothetical protein
MPFNYTNKTAGELIRSQDWNAAMQAIADLFDKFNFDATIGHGHTGGPEDGPQIGTAGIQNAAITLSKIANLAVSASKLANNAVTTSKIADGAVTASKIGPNAVNASHIVSGQVGNSELANGAVTSTKIGTNAVNATHIASGQVGNSELASNAVTGIKIANGTITGSKIANGTITGSKIATNSLSSAQLGTNSVGNSELQSNSVTLPKIHPTTRNELIAVAVSNVGDGQTAARPNGFNTSECIFAVMLNTIQFNASASGSLIVKAAVNSSGTVTITDTSGQSGGQATVIAFARRGGW